MIVVHHKRATQVRTYKQAAQKVMPAIRGNERVSIEGARANLLFERGNDHAVISTSDDPGFKIPVKGLRARKLRRMLQRMA